MTYRYDVDYVKDVGVGAAALVRSVIFGN